MNIVKLGFFGCALLTSGCSSAYDSAPIDPPKKNNKWITIQGVIPPHVSANIYPQYRSTVCKKPRAMSDGTVGTTDNLSEYKITVLPDTDGSYQGKVALYGGSHCDWLLYNIVFFTHPKSIDKYIYALPIEYRNIDFKITGESVNVPIIKTDDSYISQTIKLQENYYPVFSFKLPIKNGLGKTLFIEKIDKISKKYKFNYNESVSHELGFITYSPTIDERYVVYKKSTGKNITNNVVIENHYPNGSVGINEFSLRPYKFYDNNK
ncbi:hypothetical protein [Aeromonas rivuli]|uniref:hypothetical protein n=1 Tax=Aeromonas rivuli TaxID=648794 RepID=UPI001CCD8700|nr:hypothetical protein [Aeromonas rivuli]UBO73954.1 hypothetical protein KYK33_19575 [Aeromonas rivuli]